MARKTGGTRGDVRQSALWGSGNRGGEFRTNALWGKGGKGTIVLLVVLVLPLLSVAASARSTGPEAVGPTYVEPGLLERALDNPHQMFQVIVQSTAGASSAEETFENVEEADDQALENEEEQAEQAEKKANAAESKAKRKADRERLRAERAHWKAQRDVLKTLQKELDGDLENSFDFIKGVSIEIAGRRLAQLALKPGLTITEDVPVKLTSTDAHIWPAASGILPLLGLELEFGAERPRSRSSTPACSETGPTSATARESLTTRSSPTWSRTRPGMVAATAHSWRASPRAALPVGSAPRRPRRSSTST